MKLDLKRIGDIEISNINKLEFGEGALAPLVLTSIQDAAPVTLLAGPSGEQQSLAMIIKKLSYPELQKEFLNRRQEPFDIMIAALQQKDPTRSSRQAAKVKIRKVLKDSKPVIFSLKAALDQRWDFISLQIRKLKAVMKANKDAYSHEPKKQPVEASQVAARATISTASSICHTVDPLISTLKVDKAPGFEKFASFQEFRGLVNNTLLENILKTGVAPPEMVPIGARIALLSVCTASMEGITPLVHGSAFMAFFELHVENAQIGGVKEWMAYVKENRPCSL